MKLRPLLLTIACVASAQPVFAQVPQLLNYQGRVTVGGTNFTGAGQFKFALVNPAGSTNYWSNDGRTAGQPATAVALSVSKGLYSVLLGDTSVTGMSAAIPPLLFANSDVRLRVWFNDGVSGFQQLTPDQRIAAVGYAMVAATVDPSADVRGQRLFIGSGHTLSGVNSTVAGGAANKATNNYATVAGGRGNIAGGIGSATGGGMTNTAAGLDATVAGGTLNLASGAASTIGGGHGNLAGGSESAVTGGMSNGTFGAFSFVGGGCGNIARGYASTIAGGYFNGATNYATVAGGLGNIARGAGATVGGGVTNIASGLEATISGGELNLATGAVSTIGGGYGNLAGGSQATVAGGLLNSTPGATAVVGGGYGNLAGGSQATVAGGLLNSAPGAISVVGGGYGNIARGYASTVPGGFANLAGGQYSYAAGAGAVATNDGSFVWADASSTNAVRSAANNQLTARCAGGIRFFANSTATIGVKLAAGGNAWSAASDRNLKENFKPVDTRAVLAKLAATPVTEWNLIAQDPSTRHIGPMAQDFKAAFGVGEDDRHISTTDADGVAFAAIQGLNEIVKEKDARIAELEKRLGSLERTVEQLHHIPDQTSAPTPHDNK